MSWDTPLTRAVHNFRMFAPPRDSLRDRFSTFIVCDRPHYIAQAEDPITSELRGAMGRAVMEETR